MTRIKNSNLSIYQNFQGTFIFDTIVHAKKLLKLFQLPESNREKNIFSTFADLNYNLFMLLYRKDCFQGEG